MRLLTKILMIPSVAILFADPPNWVDDPGGYMSVATIAGSIILSDGENMAETGDMFGAFDDDGNVRGIAVQLIPDFGPHNGEIIYEMALRSNAAGDLLYFKYYDASEDIELDIVETYEFIINDLDYFQSSLTTALKNIPAFTIIGRGLGIFVAETPVIHIRWNINEKLLQFKHLVSNFLDHSQNERVISNYSIDLNWIPKTTLAYKDTSYKDLSKIIGFCALYPHLLFI